MFDSPLVPRGSLRRFAVVGAVFASSLLSCGREITGPENGVGLRVAHGLSFVAAFPEPLAAVEEGAGSIIAFNRVRVLFRRMDGSVALDRLVDFPEGQTEVELSLSVPLLNSAPPEGEPLQLYLRYINAGGDTVFSGGPVSVVAVPTRSSGESPPAPVSVPVTYTGPGAEATTVTISPDTLWVNAGESFTFTAAAYDGQGGAVSAAPVLWTSLDTAMTTLPNLTSGAGSARLARGAARVRVALAAGGTGSGWADTAVVMVVPVAGSLSLFAGGNQTAGVGTQLANAVVVRVRATDSLPLAGVSVTFAPGTGFGSVTPATVVTDTAGHAATTWRLGSTLGTQRMTATVTGLTPVEITATGDASAGVILTTSVIPAADTLSYFGETVTLAAASRDGIDSLIVGTYTWRSLDDSIATVSATGLVTAVKNGLARIVATETGGTADTASILVRQQVASVTITPGSREIFYGASFTFTAQAVDGGGTAMATQLPITWSVQNAALASVDSTGRVTGTGFGTTELRATIGGIQGVASITIKSAISRIAVLRDSVGFAQTDTFTIVALQRTRSYRAVAYDTLDAVMSGITFVIESSNPSVAVLDSTGTTTARIKAVANGVTNVRATAQGVTGSAVLLVQQQLASLDLSPNVVNVGPSGSQLLTVRGLDRDGYFLPSVTGVTFTSLQPTIATVNATSGLVTGVSAGTALITASKDSIAADTITANVGTGVAAVISFGRDSLAIGRSGSASIPIYLSKPSTSPVTVQLAVADTFAFFSAASVVISAGQTSVNVTLNGRNAGVTRIYAIDGSAVSSYAGDTATLAVQANVRFTTTSYSLVANQSLSTQILLSDPAPPGGSYISYQFGTPGRVQISPDPAFIPAGQLAANVVITALAGGSSTVTPVTNGATGQTATVNTYAASLNIAGSQYNLGLGQLREDAYVATLTNLTQSLNITLTSSDTNIVKVPSSVLIPAGTYYVYYPTRAAGPNRGSAWVYATAAGWVKDSALIVVSSPRVGLCCTNSIQTTSPAINYSASVRDSVGNQYPRITPLVVNLESSDTSIVRLNQSTATIAAGAGSVSGISYIPGGGTGTARIRVSAPGHSTDSITISVVGPKLSFSTAENRVGLGQRNSNTYVFVPNNTTAPLLVTFTKKVGGIVSLPDTVYIPTGTYYRYFSFDGLVAGRDTIFASAPDHQPDTLAVVASSPRLAGLNLGTYNNFAPPFAVGVSTQDSVGGGYPVVDTLVVSLSSSDATVARVTATARVLPGAGSTSTAQITIVGEGSAVITATAPGYRPIVDTMTVQRPKISFSTASYRLGRRQLSGTSAVYVQVPNNVIDTLRVTITRSNTSIDSLVSSGDIPAGTYYRYFGIAGLQTGIDTLIVSAPGYLPDTMTIVVTSPRISVGGIATPRTTTTPPTTFSVTTTDSVGTAHATMDTLVLSVSSTNSSVLQPAQASYRILPNTQSVSPQVSFSGAGTALIIVSDSAGTGYGSDSTNLVTVTGPGFTLTNSTPKLGMRQHNGDFGAYVSVPNTVTGSPITVSLVSSDTSVVTVPATVQIPVGTYYAYFRVTARDVEATVQITATATGYASANMIQQVTAPRFVISAPTSMRSTQNPGSITVYAADADGTQHPTTENVVVTLSSSAPALAGIDSATVTILANSSSNNRARVLPQRDTVGTLQLSATDSRTQSWRYGQATSNLSITRPNLTLNWTNASIGVGQWADVSVSTPDNLRPAVTVNLARKTNTVSAPASVVVDSGQYTRTFRITGVSVGLDSIKASGTGHNPDSAAVTVGLGRIDGIVSWPTTMTTDTVLVTLRTKGPDGSIRNVAAATTFTLSADANVKFVSAGAGPADITSVTVPADASQVQFRLVRTGSGTANVSISNANYTAYTSAITVNAP